MSQRRLMVGFFLLLWGMYLFLQRAYGLPTAFLPLLLGGSFLGLYYWQRREGDHRPGILFVGLLFVNLGLLYLFYQWGWLQKNMDWPFTFVAVGLSFILLWLLGGIQRLSWAVIPGLVLIVAGALLLLQNWGWLHLDGESYLFDLSRYWPVFLILVGLFLLLG